MAKPGPFGTTTGNQASDIEAAQAVGGAPQGDSSLVEGVTKLAQIIIPVVRDNKARSVTDDLNEQTSSVKDFLKLARNPELLTSEFGVAAVENPSVRQALADFVDVRDEREQGILPSRFALERLEVIQNDAIANAPEFAKEIRMAMVAATGQDPAKTLFAQLLRPKPAAAKTQQEKAEDAIQFSMAKNQVTREAVIAASRAEMENAFAQDTYEINKRNNTVRLEDISASANRHASVLHGRILQAVNLAVISPEGLTDEVSNQILTQMNLDVMNAESAVRSGLEGRYSQKDLDDSLGGLYRWRDSMREIIKDNELANLVGNKTAMMQTLIMGEFMKDPSSAAAYTMGGPKMFAELEKLFSMKDNRMMGELSKSLFPAQKQAADAARTGARAFQGQERGTQFGMPNKVEVIKSFTEMGDGGMDGLDAKGKTSRRIAANLTFRTPDVKPEMMEKAVMDLDDDYGWRAIQNNKVIPAAKKHPVLARRVNILVGNQIGALAFEYTNTITGLQGFNADNLKMVGNKLVYKNNEVSRAQDKSAADFEIPAFVERFNVAASVAERYSRVGVLDASKFTSSQAFFDTIKTAVEQQQTETNKPITSGIPEYVRGADGIIKLKRG